MSMLRRAISLLSKIDISGIEAILMRGEEDKKAARNPKLRKKALRLANENLRVLKKEWEDRQ